MGKGLLSPNDKSCSGKGGRGGSMAGSDGGWLSKSLIESNDGRRGGELVNSLDGWKSLSPLQLAVEEVMSD
ncbi:hypothetical protein Tco_1238016 [Tanacetum coccineum]